MNVIVSCSLNSDSNSRVLAREAQRILEADGQPVTWLDLRDQARSPVDRLLPKSAALPGPGRG